MNVIFTGGGTGGHLYPAIAIADELKKRHDVSITFVGTADRLETTIVPEAGYKLETISARPFSRSLKFITENIKGVFQSRTLLKKLKPDIIIATGGYVCFPFVLAARLRFKKIPVALLEPNARSGLTNRVLTPLVDEIWHEAPVRSSVTGAKAIPKIDARQRLGLDTNKNVLLVIGGSQGARSINEALIEAAMKNLLPENWQTLLISGKLQTAIPQAPNLRVIGYLNDMSDAYAATDLVLTRAGASTLAELRALGLPAILIPYPFATDNHQEINAYDFAKTNQAIVLRDEDLTGETLAETMAESLKGKGRLRNVGPTTGAMDGGREEAVERERSPEGGANSGSATAPCPSGSPAQDPLGRILARIEGVLSRKHA